tara:strand:+ start:484 stop:711 length:228 start_codon:yes stop_codon:yes gene_type:complete
MGNSIYGIVGFSHIEGSWFWNVLIVRGKHCYRIPLLYPFYYILFALYKRRIQMNLESYKKHEEPYRSFNVDEGIE